jgi:hypothetical protein
VVPSRQYPPSMHSQLPSKPKSKPGWPASMHASKPGWPASNRSGRLDGMVVLQPEDEARFKRISPTDAAHGRRQRVAHDGPSARALPLPGRGMPGSMLLDKGVGKGGGVGKGVGKGDPWSPSRKRRAWEGLQGASSGNSGSARPGGSRMKYERGWRALQPGVVCTPSSCSSPGRTAEML